jgi:hypothetical protein
MKKFICVVLLAGVNVSSVVCAETIQEMLNQAAVGRGSEHWQLLRSKASGSEHKALWSDEKKEGYVALRDRIVALGANAIPELRAIHDGTTNSWQQRLMAGICLERIQHGDEIRSFRTRDWRNDPEMQNDDDWRRRGGPYAIYRVAEKRWLEAGLTNHIVQLAWKEDGECPPLGGGWSLRAARILKKMNNPYLTDIARDCLLKEARNPEDIVYDERLNLFYKHLLEVRDHESLPMMFELWLKYREFERAISYNVSRSHGMDEQRSAKFADEAADVYLGPLLVLATPADEQWITEKLKSVKLGVKGQKVLAEYQQRCRQKPGLSGQP